MGYARTGQNLNVCVAKLLLTYSNGQLNCRMLQPDDLIAIFRPSFDIHILTGRHMGILAFLFPHRKPVDFSEIAVGLGFSKPSCSRLINRLCELHMTDSARQERDRRHVLVNLTDTGREFVHSMLKAAEAR